MKQSYVWRVNHIKNKNDHEALTPAQIVYNSPYILAHIVAVSNDLSILKNLRISSKGGINRHNASANALMDMFIVIKEVFHDSVCITYMDKRTGSVRRKETLENNGTLEDLTVEVFTKKDNRKLIQKAYKYSHFCFDYLRPIKRHFLSYMNDKTMEVVMMTRPYENPIRHEILEQPYHRKNYPLEPSFWNTPLQRHTQ